MCFGWGTRYENGRRLSSRPAMVANENHHMEHDGDDHMTLETPVEVEHYVHTEHNDSYRLLDLVKERAEELASEAFAGFSKEKPCVGEDCDIECLIPEDWSPKPGDMDSKEVMSFLGIRRVEPLRRPTDWE